MSEGGRGDEDLQYLSKRLKRLQKATVTYLVKNVLHVATKHMMLHFLMMDVCAGGGNSRLSSLGRGRC